MIPAAEGILRKKLLKSILKNDPSPMKAQLCWGSLSRHGDRQAEIAGLYQLL